jgi:transposase
MKSPEELAGRFGGEAVGLARYALDLERQLEEKEQLLVEKEQLLSEKEQLLAEARALIAQLRKELLGPKSDKLTPEQEEQLRRLAADLEEQARRAPPLSREVLQQERAKDRKRAEARQARRRHPTPVKLEIERVVIEPPDKRCAHCRREMKPMGQEVSTEYDYRPAKLICRETIRPKYGCHCGCGGVVIGPLAPRLVPQSRLGLGLAVHLLLSRFDDHVAYYTLERNFWERHGVRIPRQQMVQWVEQIAFLLLAIYRLIWEEMSRGDYLQLDETPVKVLDPEVQGKAATGYLWIYAVPGQDVFLEFSPTRGQEAPRQRLAGFHGTIQTDAYAVYDALRRDRPRSLRRIGCATHARRRFYQALEESASEAVWFIGQLRQLYQNRGPAQGLQPGRATEGASATGAGALAGAQQTRSSLARPSRFPPSEHHGQGGELLSGRIHCAGRIPAGRSLRNR